MYRFACLCVGWLYRSMCIQEPVEARSLGSPLTGVTGGSRGTEVTAGTHTAVSDTAASFLNHRVIPTAPVHVLFVDRITLHCLG